MYIYGRNVLKEIINAKYPVRQIYFSNSTNSDKELTSLIKLAEKNNYPMSLVPPQVLKRMTEVEKNQGVVVDMDEFKYAEFAVIEKIKDHAPLIVMLDQLNDPHNFGAIIRSAVASGADAIIIPKDNSVEVTPTVIKVSVGQVFKIPIIKVTNLARTIEELKKLNIWVYGADMDGQIFYNVDMTDGTCIVMGNEGEGIRKNVHDHCDNIISIPMANEVESLNVSVSAGIILFEILKQRSGKKI